MMLKRRDPHSLMVALPLWIVLILLLSTCGGPLQSKGPVTKASTDKQIAVLPLLTSDIATFDPALAGDFFSITAVDAVFTGLVALDDHLNVQPQLAASYQQMPDGLTWKFTLRPNLKFSDGTPLTSQDVVYSIDHALQPAEKSPSAPFFLGLLKDADKLAAGQIKTLIGDSLIAPDSTTVIIVTSKRASYFLDALTRSCSYVVEKRLIDKYGAQWTDHLTEGGGDGPFKLAEYTHSQRIVFVPNPNYYGPIPQLRKVIYLFYQDAGSAYKTYQAGQLDEITTIPPEQLAAARQLTREFHAVPLLGIRYYTMNYLTKPFDNIKIRQAFALAINKDLIVHTIWHDSRIATNHIVPQGMPGYNPNLLGPAGVKGTAGDPAKARLLFQQGLQEEGLTLATLPPIHLTYPSSDPGSKEEVALQQIWQQVLGVTVILDPVDFNKLLSEIDAATNNPHGLQFWGEAAGADYPDPQDILTLGFDRGNPMNYGQNNTAVASEQQAVQQQLEAADSNPDQNMRLQQYMQAEQQLVNDVALLPMNQLIMDYLRKPCVVGWVDNPETVLPPNDWGAIYISTDPNCADTSGFR